MPVETSAHSMSVAVSAVHGSAGRPSPRPGRDPAAVGELRADDGATVPRGVRIGALDPVDGPVDGLVDGLVDGPFDGDQPRVVADEVPYPLPPAVRGPALWESA